MADSNLVDFYDRVGRISSAHKRGISFVAAGTLGRGLPMRKSKRRKSFLAPLLFVTLALFCLKGSLYYVAGGAAYENRVNAMLTGEGFDRLGGMIMQADPVTLFIAEKISKVLITVG
ncbi:MAG: hypothetical protein RIR95_2025 [Pseudomonadota bacterium]|jgi:hypothetical protein